MKRTALIATLFLMACVNKQDRLRELKSSEREVQGKIEHLDSGYIFKEMQRSPYNIGRERSSAAEILSDSLSIRSETEYRIQHIRLNQILDSIQREIAMLSPDSVD